MKKLLISLGILGLAAGMALAKPGFQFSDSGFNYFDSDSGYTTLDYQDGVFVLNLSDEASPAALEITEIEGLPLSEDSKDELSQAQLRDELPLEVEANHLQTTYPDANLATTVENFDTRFQGFGFTGEVEKSSLNQTIMVYSNQDVTARAIFTRQGEAVTVYIHTL